MEKETTEVKLAKSLGLSEALTIGIGTMIGAGVFVLPALAARNAGPAAVLSFAIGAVAALLTAASTAELASGMPKSGGGYYFVSRAFGPLVGSIVGYGLWFGLIFASSFYAVGFGRYLSYFVPLSSERLAALIGGVLLVVINYIGAKETGRIQNITVSILLIILGFYVIWGLFAIDTSLLRPFMPMGVGAVGKTASLIFVSYLGFAQIASVSEEIIEPQKNLPIAIIGSVLIVAVIYMLVLVVTFGLIPYTELQHLTTPLADAATIIMGSIGGIALAFAGLLACISSANASIMAAARINYAMGKDELSSSWLNQIHHRFQTPSRSIAITGAIVSLLVLVGRLEILAEVASFVHLILYALMNIAVVIMRMSKSDWYKPSFKVPFGIWIPVLGTIFCFIIIFQMEILAVIIGLAISVGAILIYLVWARKWTPLEGLLSSAYAQRRIAAELKRTQREFSIFSEKLLEPERPRTVLACVSNPATEDAILQLAGAFAKEDQPILVLSVLQIPDTISLKAAEEEFRSKRTKRAAEIEKALKEKGIQDTDDQELVHRITVLSRSVHKAILQNANQSNAELILMGWRKLWRPQKYIGSVTNQVMKGATADVVIFKGNYIGNVKKILIPFGGGPNAALGLELGIKLAQDFDAELTVLRILSPDLPDKDKKRLTLEMEESIENKMLPIRAEVIERFSALDTIIERGNQSDLLIIGAGKPSLREPTRTGAMTSRVVEHVNTPTLIIHKKK